MSSPTDATTALEIGRLKREQDVLGLLRYVDDDSNPAVQSLALDTILSLGQSVIPTLIEALPDVNAGTALAACRDSAIYDVLRLSRGCEATEDSQRRALCALLQFAHMLGDARAFYEIQRLEREGLTADVRQLADRVMSQMDPALGQQLDRLSRLVDQLAPEDPDQLRRAASRVAELGPRAIPMLLYKAREPRLQAGVGLVLTVIGETAVQPTVMAFKAGTPGVAWALTCLGQDHQVARDWVEWAAKSHGDPQIRAEAAQALDMRRAADTLL